MPNSLQDFDDRSLRSHLQRCGFFKENIVADFKVSARSVPLLAFSHRPFDTRTACAAAAPPADDQDLFLDAARKTGSPLAFVGSGTHWTVWGLTRDVPTRLWDADRGSLDSFFKAFKDQLDPRSLFRAKTLRPQGAWVQATLVDAGLLDMVESEASQQLCRLVESMVLVTREKLNMAALPQLAEMDAQWLVQANFWLLAARLLHDKQVKGFKTLDLQNVENTFARVGRHYGSTMTHHLSIRRRKALEAAVKILGSHASLRLVSTETLAQVYENVLVTKETRKALGTHGTPAWLVNYIVERLAPWVESQAPARRRVYEPGCGHAPFLVAMLRLLSGMRPCVTLDDEARHEWLKTRLCGAETDDFAREVARLSLTLADIPNPNGWELDHRDMFADGKLISRIQNSDVIISNPPFEARTSDNGELFHVSQSAELLRLICVHSTPGTLVAYIMPQTVLNSKKTRKLREDLLKRFEWMEIIRLPDKVFEKADVETAVLIGKRLDTHKVPPRAAINCKNVWNGDLSKFRSTGVGTFEQIREVSSMLEGGDPSMLVPDLAEVWDHCSHYVRLEEVATVGHGLLYYSESKIDADGELIFPEGQTQRVAKRTPGYEQGFFNLKGAPYTHLEPELQWINKNPNVVARRRDGFTTGIPQIVMNYVPIKRGPWRIKAYIDRVGRRACSDFLLVRSTDSRWTLNCLWALLNSPVANAFVSSFSSKKHIYSSRLLQLPVPVLDDEQIRNLDRMVAGYFEVATKQFPSGSRPLRLPESPLNRREGDLFDFEAANVEGEVKNFSQEVSNRLACIDRHLLEHYGLPPELERKVLDYFTGFKRPGVPFEHAQYFPAGFKGANTLSELVKISVEWDSTNNRRLSLINQEYSGTLSPEEDEELELLQELATLRRRLVAPYPIDEIDAEIERLKREGKWTE